MNIYERFEMYRNVLDIANRMGVVDKIEQIAFEVGYIAVVNGWPYQKAIKWALENIVEEQVGEHTIVKLNKKAQLMAIEAYKKTKEEVFRCYKCGKSDVITDKDDWRREQYQHFSVSFGYGSDYDMERWSWTLCEDCLVDIIRTFKHVPRGFFVDPQYVDPKKDRHQAVFEKWKKTGQWNFDDLYGEQETE